MILIATILNLGVICLGIWTFADDGVDPSTFWIYLLLFSCPLVNLYILCRHKLQKDEGLVGLYNASWIGLYFKRKRLEERQKIDQLSAKDEQD